MEIAHKLFDEYKSKTPFRLKLIDVYMLYVLLTGAVQFFYCVLVGSFPFNSFLSGFISCVGTFVLFASLRLQLNPNNKLNVSSERAFADFVFCNVVFHLAVFNFLG